MSRLLGGRNLILGLAEGLTWAQLRPFVESLNRTSFSGDVHLFVGRTDDETMSALRAEGVILHPYRLLRYERDGQIYHAYALPFRRFRSSRLTPFYPSVIRALCRVQSNELMGRARLAAPISIPHVARYFRFYRFLADNANSTYENVMVSDVYDVFFQRDPFAFEIGDDVHAFLEDHRQTIASERYHRDWFRIAYDEKTLRELGDKPISCSGVTIARRSGMLAYLRVMTEELLKLPRQTVGIDQGVHNYAIHRQLVPRVQLVPNGAGAVFTVSHVPPREIDAALDEGRDGWNVVHQYQHHARLRKTLLGRLV
jgi:hypothetical protein